MIPAMTDPLGKHWDQPADIREAPMDDKTVLLTPRQFEELHEYSATMPSGVYPGKCWKRLEPWNRPTPERTLLVWYGIADDPSKCTIEFRDIEIVT